MRCDGCARWVLERRRLYDDGKEVTFFQVTGGKGLCEQLKIETAPDFGCAAFSHDPEPEAAHVRTERLVGASWQHFHMGKCPDCAGRGSGVEGGVCHRCVGAGQVRFYDDGVVGDERTRKHPHEIDADRLADEAKRRAAAQAILAGLPPPADDAPVFDGRALAQVEKPSIL